MKKYKYVKDLTINGKRYKFRADSAVELGEKIAKKKYELETGRITINGNTLVKDWAVQCVENYKTNQNDDTRKNYIYKLNKIQEENLNDEAIKIIDDNVSEEKRQAMWRMWQIS